MWWLGALRNLAWFMARATWAAKAQLLAKLRPHASLGINSNSSRSIARQIPGPSPTRDAAYQTSTAGSTFLWYMGKMGSICHFPCAFPASIWGRCSQVLVFTSMWGTQKRVWQWHFSCCFSQHLGILGLPNTAKQGKTQNDKSTLFYPPHIPLFPESPLVTLWSKTDRKTMTPYHQRSHALKMVSCCSNRFQERRRHVNINLFGRSLLRSGVKDVSNILRAHRHKCFCPGTRSGRPMTGLTGQSSIC